MVAKIKSSLYGDIDLTVVEPKFSRSPIFMDKVEKLGYKTQKAIAYRRQEMKAIGRVMEEARLRKEELQIERVLTSSRGTKICKVVYDSAFGVEVVYIGFIDEVSGNNLRVTLEDAHVKNRLNLKPNNFTRGVRWTEPDGWYPC